MIRAILFIVALALLSAGEAWPQAQDYGNRLGQGHGTGLQFLPRGRTALTSAIDPRVQKWYLPQELYSEYRLNQWNYTNYSRDFYLRFSGGERRPPETLLLSTRKPIDSGSIASDIRH